MRHVFDREGTRAGRGSIVRLGRAHARGRGSFIDGLGILVSIVVFRLLLLLLLVVLIRMLSIIAILAVIVHSSTITARIVNLVLLVAAPLIIGGSIQNKLETLRAQFGRLDFDAGSAAAHCCCYCGEIKILSQALIIFVGACTGRSIWAGGCDFQSAASSLLDT